MSNFVKYSGVKCKRSSSVFSFEVSKRESQSLHLTNSEVFFACVLLVLSQFDRTQDCFDRRVNDKLQFASILIKIIVQLQNAWPLLNILSPNEPSRLPARHWKNLYGVKCWVHILNRSCGYRKWLKERGITHFTQLWGTTNSLMLVFKFAYVGEFTSRRWRVGVGEFARRRVDQIPIDWLGPKSS